MGKPRYTQVDGHRVLQVRVSIEIQEAEVKWVSEQLEITESAAIALMRGQLQQALRGHHEWHRWCVRKGGDGTPQLVRIHVNKVTPEEICFGDLTS